MKANTRILIRQIMEQGMFRYCLNRMMREATHHTKISYPDLPNDEEVKLAILFTLWKCIFNEMPPTELKSNNITIPGAYYDPE